MTPKHSARPAKEVLDDGDVERAATRIAHEIIERNQGVDGLVVVGIQTGGVWLAEHIANKLGTIDPGRTAPPLGTIDVSMHRDDIGRRPVSAASVTNLGSGIDDRITVLVDDVLFTGRTVKAALDALGEYGRPRCVQLAVLIDRGHRELPIRPDYVGKNLPTSRNETVSATSAGVIIQ